MGLHRLYGLVNGIAFCNTSQVKPHTFNGKLHCAVLTVELELLKTYFRPGVGNFILVREGLFVFCLTKQFHKRPDGNIERAIGKLAEFDAFL